ncbi:MAG: CPBP family intramembrane metalloprotease [Chloroflexi bacterium]|nr:CPBP family intramembrane metalloprotease [Chloroflexota bacterium]
MAVEAESPALKDLFLDVLTRLPDSRRKDGKQEALPRVITLSACAALCGLSLYAVSRRGRNRDAAMESIGPESEGVGELAERQHASAAVTAADPYLRAPSERTRWRSATRVRPRERRAARRAARVWAAAGTYLLAVALAEIVTAAVNPVLGVSAHALLLFALLVQGARADGAQRGLLWSLTVAPLIRILSLSLPLSELPVIYWYALIGVPLLAAVMIIARVLGYSRRDLGLTMEIGHLLLYLAMMPLGMAVGVAELLLLRPQPLVNSLTLADLWLPALILTASTGFGEELVFRGLLQRAALRLLGSWGLVYVAALFAGLSIGYSSVPNLVLVFTMGLLFAVIARRTGSILGPSLAHAAANVSLFLVAPFVIGR